MQGTYFSVSLDFRASSLKVNSQAGLLLSRERACPVVECVCVCVAGGRGEPREVVSVMVMSSFLLLTLLK